MIKKHLSIMASRKQRHRTVEEIQFDMDMSEKCRAMKHYKSESDIHLEEEGEYKE